MASLLLLTLLGPVALPGQDPAAVPAPDLPEMRELLEVRLERLDEQISKTPAVPLLWNRLRVLYLLAVGSDRWIEPAAEAIGALRSVLPATDPFGSARLEAYLGALEVVRGKHAFWPHSKVSLVRNGLQSLDAAVVQAPNDVETRNLRLLSTFYLPFFFRRGDSARADLRALADVLPLQRGALPAEDLLAVVEFVLEQGSLDEEQRQALLDLAGALRSGHAGSERDRP